MTMYFSGDLYPFERETEGRRQRESERERERKSGYWTPNFEIKTRVRPFLRYITFLFPKVGIRFTI